MASMRERGTPKGPLSSKSRWVILLLFVLGSSAATTWILVDDFTIGISLASTAGISAIGAIAALTGLIHDGIVFALGLEIMVYGSVFLSEFIHGSIPQTPEETSLVKSATTSALLMASPILIVAIVGSLIPSIFSIFAPMLNPIIVSAVAVFPLLSLGVGSMLLLKDGDLTLPTLACTVVGIATLLLLVAWYINRSNKQLNLLNPTETGIAFCTAVALVASVHQRSTPAAGTIELLMAALMGSTVCTLAAATLCAVADVWNTVGTGQFWMVSLDTSCMYVYFILPLVFLAGRFNAMYGETVHDTLSGMIQSVELESMPMSPTEMTNSALMLLLSVCTTLGVAMVRALCPFAGYLYGRVYTHGQLNTKKIAVCLDWTECKDLLSSKQLQESNIHLNFVTTFQNLVDDADALKAADKAGHGVVPYTGDQDAHAEYIKAFERIPTWSHGDADPSDIVQVAKRGTKIALWSNYCTKYVNTEELLADVETHDGGAIICLEGIPNVLDVIKELSSKGFTVAHLSDVAKDDIPMILDEKK